MELLLVYINNFFPLQLIDELVTVRVATEVRFRFDLSQEMLFRFDLNLEARRLGLAASCR